MTLTHFQQLKQQQQHQDVKRLEKHFDQKCENPTLEDRQESQQRLCLLLHLQAILVSPEHICPSRKNLNVELTWEGNQIQIFFIVCL